MAGKNLIGERFGRLIVIKEKGRNKRRQKIWLCKCDCGKEKEIPTSYLTSGDTTSCGCYRKECEIKNLSKTWGKPRTHGLSNTRLYQIWADMKDRCYNIKSVSYKDYGERGVKVCDEWINDFVCFYNWAIKNGYNDTLSIDRINVNGNYEPNNCRWTTSKEQANNKRNTRKITIYGETKTAYEFEKQYGIKAHLLIDRYNKGYRDDKLIYEGHLGHFRDYTKQKKNEKAKVYGIYEDNNYKKCIFIGTARQIMQEYKCSKATVSQVAKGRFKFRKKYLIKEQEETKDANK